jgi:hypothetical protein
MARKSKTDAELKSILKAMQGMIVPFCMWVIIDKRGRIWRYVDDAPVMWFRRKDAAYDCLRLDPKRGWRPHKVSVRSAGGRRSQSNTGAAHD